MAKIIFLETFDFSAITAGSEAAGFPALNAGNDMMETEWRPNGAADHVLIDLGEAKAFDTVAAINVRSTQTFTMRVRTDNDSDPTSGADWNTGATTFGSSRLDDTDFSHGVLTRSSTITNRYIRIDFEDANNVGGFGVGRILIGKRFEPKCNYAYGLQHITAPAVAPGRNIFNAADIAPTAIRDDLRVSLPYLDADEALGDMRRLERGAARGKPLLCHLNIDDTDHFDQKLYYGLARTGFQRRHQSHQSYAVSVDLAGLI